MPPPRRRPSKPFVPRARARAARDAREAERRKTRPHHKGIKSTPEPRNPKRLRWLWGVLALAVGVFIAPADWGTWILCGVGVVLGVLGIVLKRPWAPALVWVGAGLVAAVVVVFVLDLIPTDGFGIFTSPHPAGPTASAAPN